jgi:acyl carrier protein
MAASVTGTPLSGFPGRRPFARRRRNSAISFQLVTTSFWPFPVYVVKSPMDIPDNLLHFINEARQPLPPVNDADEKLHLDSLAMMKLVAFLETDVGYTVQDEELTLQNFESLRSISRLLQGEGAKMT